jgi:Xaa-Pro aminopeptidase
MSASTRTPAGTQERLARASRLLSDEALDLLLVSPSADLRYLLGYPARPTERPTLLALGGEGQGLLLVPRLEAPRAQVSAAVRVVAYGETESPYQTLARALPLPEGRRRIAVSDQMWASVLLSLQQAFPAAQFCAAAPVLRRLRMVKSESELSLLLQAGEAADAVVGQVLQLRFAGRQEREIAAELAGLLRGTGLDEVWTTVAAGPNSASPHHLTGRREIHEGDALVLDFGGALEGYQADITRTIHVGTPEDEFRRVYDVVRQAQEVGVRAVQAGKAAEDVDRAARQAVERYGYGDFFVHRTGHGIGLEVHEEP